MDLVNEYLRAVSILLPRAQREDIIAELRDTILTIIETKEAELGRPLNDDEVEAVLREVGHPLVVAARYREGPQHVVGPTLYPYWAFVVKVGIVLQLAIGLIVLLIRTIGGDFPEAFGQAIGSAMTGALIIVGLATIAAWLIERQGWQIDYLKTWRVRDLRMLDFTAWDLDRVRTWFSDHADRSPRAPRAPRPDYAPADPPPAPRFPAAYGSMSHRSMTGDALAGIAAGTVFILLWTGAIPFGLIGRAGDLHDLGMDPGSLAGVDWHGLRETLFWPVLAFGGYIVLRGVIGLAWPRAVRLHGLLEAISGAISLAFLAWVWNDSPIASGIRVDSMASFALRMAEFKTHAPLVPLVPVLTIVVIACAFSGACVVLRGVWLMLAGSWIYGERW